MPKIFVYGTLRARADDDTVYYLPGFKMHATPRFPYIEYTGLQEHVVVGQLLTVRDAPHLESLDRYEGVASGLYRRVAVAVYRQPQVGGLVEDVEAYVKGPAFDYPQIVHGDWLRYVEERNDAQS